MIGFAMFGLHCVLTSGLADNCTTYNFDANCPCHIECNSSNSTDKNCEDEANVTIVNCHGPVDLAYFSGLNKSNHLRLTFNSCDLENITAGTLSNCPPISILQFINCTNLTSIDSGAFAGHESHLESLGFSNCNLQKLSMKPFEKLTKLTTLSIEKNLLPILFAGAQLRHEPENTTATNSNTTAVVDVCLNGTCNQNETRTVKNDTRTAFENGTHSENESQPIHDSFSIPIAGIVVAVVFVLLIAAVIYCIWQRRYAILKSK